MDEMRRPWYPTRWRLNKPGELACLNDDRCRDISLNDGAEEGAAYIYIYIYIYILRRVLKLEFGKSCINDDVGLFG